jgi:hypothetical protein
MCDFLPSPQAKGQRVAEVLHDLRIAHVADSYIGDKAER